ncbi:MAG: hypothetical protein JSV03_06375 [Planctomycetota bacterium]|nr:MAG: hypothetical protein JSV03_06375 [Planctomycetota bacterium]
MKKILIVMGVLTFASSAMAAGIYYHEHWDSYDDSDWSVWPPWHDPTYTAVWTPDATVNPGWPRIWNFTDRYYTIPNAILIDSRNRAIDNDLADGITNGTSDGAELKPGQSVFPGGDLDNSRNLSLGYYLLYKNKKMRKFAASYVEISSGGLHAPWGAGALDPLPNPIPVVAIGSLNGLFTGTGINGENVAVYFFDGQQWVRTSPGTTSGWNRMWAQIYYDSGDSTWKARIREDKQGLVGTYNLAFDPSILGFDTISWRDINSGSQWSGDCTGDDVYLVGGYKIVTAPLDITPHDCPNLFTVNMKSKGRIPMAILGSEDLNVADINIDSISIGEVIFPVKTPSIEDVSGPMGDPCACGTGVPDGYDDLVVHFSRRDLIGALGLDLLEVGTEVEVIVKGDIGGDVIEAKDCITLQARED